MARAGGATGWIAPSLGLLFAIDVPTGGERGARARGGRGSCTRVDWSLDGSRAARAVDGPAWACAESDLKT